MLATINNSLSLQKQGRHQEAIAYLTSLQLQDPTYVDYYSLLAISYEALDNITMAIQCLKQAIQLVPNNGYFHAHMGKLYYRRHDFKNACDAWQHAVTYTINSAEYFTSYALALLAINQDQLAFICLEEALSIDPAYAPALATLGDYYCRQHNFVESNNFYHSAIEIAPDNARYHCKLSTLYLQVGDFEIGFREYDWRWKTVEGKRSLPLNGQWWQGECLQNKTLLITFEQGLGDYVQFIRYLQPLQQQFADCRICLAVPPTLIALMTTIPGIAACVDKISIDPSAFDYYVPVMDLPLRLQARYEQIPPPITLTIADLLIKQWQQRLAHLTKPRIGICWSGNPHNPIDQIRACPLTKFSQLFSADCDFINLNVAIADQELEQLKQFNNVTDITSELTDYAQTAAVLMNLDAVITTDTSLAHVAGTLRCSTHLLLAYHADWRWFSGDRSPWYPTMTLYRQAQAGDWQQPLAAIQQLLATLTMNSHHD